LQLQSLKQRLIIVGAGDHAKVVLELAWATEQFQVEGLLDPTSEAPNLLGCPILGNDELLPILFAQGITLAAVAVGENNLRQRLCHKALSFGFRLPSLIHPSAVVSPSASIGQGVVVMAGALIGSLAKIGDFAIINSGAIVEHDNRIGNSAHIAPGVALAGRVSIGERTLIGVGSSIMPQISIGNGCTIGAGSTVIRSFADDVLAAGNPAHLLHPR
jgi:UDP-perosamine 4-acetyltransferase